jgi:predicted SnoaL-like aldol condensation-catalyzing enzyme
MRKLGSKVFALAVALVAAVFLLSAPAQAGEPTREDANKQLVRDFFAALDEAQASGTMKAKGRSIVERYIVADYIQHRPGEQNGREAMVRRTESAQFLPVGGMPPMKLVALVADGDMVVRVTSFDLPDPATGATSPALIWNMFRVRDGKLAEHWDAVPAERTGPSPAPGIQPPRR